MAMNPKLLRPRQTGKYAALRTGLVAYWPMNETATSGDVTAEDWTKRGNNLTSNNTVPSVSGKIENARSFTAGNSEYLSASGNNADLRFMDGRSWTFAGWVYVPTSWPVQQMIAARDPVTSGNREIVFECRTINSANHIVFQSAPGSTPGIFLTAGDNASVGDRLAVNTWHFFAATYDASTRVANLRVNSGTQSNELKTATLAAGTPPVGSAAFNLGRRNDGYGYFTGRLDEVAKWDRVLSSAELDTLYNSGNGIDLRK